MSQAAAFPRKSPAEDSFSRRANDGDKPKAEKVAAVKFHGASVSGKKRSNCWGFP